MRRAEIKVGGRYVAKVSNALVVVVVLREVNRHPRINWVCRNEKTGREIVVRSAQRFRSEVDERAQAVDVLVRRGDPTQEAPARLTEDEKHDLQHRRIAETEDAYDAAPRRTGADRSHRRELGKKAWWSLTGHLRSMHGVRGQAPFLRKTYEEVVVWHERLHVEEAP